MMKKINNMREKNECDCKKNHAIQSTANISPISWIGYSSMGREEKSSFSSLFF